MSAPPSMVPPNKHPKPRPQSGTRSELGTPRGPGHQKHMVCVFAAHFNLRPSPTSYLASPYCTEQEAEAPDGQGGRLKPHGW